MKIFSAGDNGYIDIIIYILVLVGGLAANAYKNYTKRKEAQERGSVEIEEEYSERPSQPLFEFELPELYPDEPEHDVAEEFERTEYTPSIPEPALDVVPPVSEKDYTEGEAVFESTREWLDQKEMNEIYGEIKDEISVGNFFEQEEDDQAGSFEFDLADAVIYSEILKPKYF